MEMKRRVTELPSVPGHCLRLVELLQALDFLVGEPQMNSTSQVVQLVHRGSPADGCRHAYGNSVLSSCTRVTQELVHRLSRAAKRAQLVPCSRRDSWQPARPCPQLSLELHAGSAQRAHRSMICERVSGLYSMEVHGSCSKRFVLESFGLVSRPRASGDHGIEPTPKCCYIRHRDFLSTGSERTDGP
jgi:hypothetical protein